MRWLSAAGSRRKDLLLIALVLLVANLLIHYEIIRPPFFEPNWNISVAVDDSTFRSAFHNAVEALEYMYNSQLGKAKVAEMAESPFNSFEIRSCSGKGTFKAYSAGRKWTRSGDFHIFSAYIDRRKNGLFPDSAAGTIRIIASSFDIGPLNRTYFCHFRKYDQRGTRWSGRIIKAHVLWIWQRAWDPRNEFYNAFLISCPSSDLNNQEAAVLVSKSQYCVDSVDVERNFTRIMDIPENPITETSLLGMEANQIRIAVCIKGLAFLDESELSARWITEWLELQWALGANAITLYAYWVPGAVRQTLETVAKRKRVKLIDLELPGDSPNQPFTRHQFIWRNRQQKRRHELIPYNDCFYRHYVNHHFVLIIDTDEVVVPLRKNRNWQSVLAENLKSHWRAEPSSLSIRNVFKFWKLQNEIESPFVHRLRSAIVQECDQYGKSFISTRSVATVFNHFALHRLHMNVSNTFFVKEVDALKLHWKNKCPKLELGDELCARIENNLIEDNLLENFKEETQAAIKRLI